MLGSRKARRSNQPPGDDSIPILTGGECWRVLAALDPDGNGRASVKVSHLEVRPVWDRVPPTKGAPMRISTGRFVSSAVALIALRLLLWLPCYATLTLVYRSTAQYRGSAEDALASSGWFLACGVVLSAYLAGVQAMSERLIGRRFGQVDWSGYRRQASVWLLLLPLMITATIGASLLDLELDRTRGPLFLSQRDVWYGLTGVFVFSRPLQMRDLVGELFGRLPLLVAILCWPLPSSGVLLVCFFLWIAPAALQYARARRGPARHELSPTVGTLVRPP
jgi:hypothetical protein